MTSKRRLQALECDLKFAETSYVERLGKALRACADGQWGLLGANDVAHDAHFGTKHGARSKEARDLMEIAVEIALMRSRLGYAQAFPVHERFMTYRKIAKGSNALGEPKLAQQFLDELNSADASDENTQRS